MTANIFAASQARQGRQDFPGQPSLIRLKPTPSPLALLAAFGGETILTITLRDARAAEDLDLGRAPRL